MLKPSGFRRRSRREVVDGETNKTNMRRAELIAFSRDKARWMEHSMGIRQPVRVLLIDDSILTLHGLKTFLSKSSHIDIVGVAKRYCRRCKKSSRGSGRNPDSSTERGGIGGTSGTSERNRLVQNYP